MPIILVTGANGHGKGQFLISEILRIQKENDALEKEGKPRRPIFTNIHGINEAPNKPLPDCQPLPENPFIFFGKQDNPQDPPPEGYFVPPIGSVFIFDEAQKFDWIQQRSGTLSSDPRVRSMEEHRHAGLDIYFSTQSPSYIHSHIQGLVSPHFHLERPLGAPITNVFRFNLFQGNVTAYAKKHADDHQTFKIGKKYGEYYKSSAEHNIKFRMPKKLQVMLFILFVIFSLFIYKAMQTKKILEKRYDKTPSEAQTPNQAQTQDISQSYNPFDNSDELTKLKNDTDINHYNRRIYLIKNHLPQDYEVVKSEPALQVRGVIKKGDKCHAYNTYGDLMTLTLDECNYYINQTGRVHKSTSQGQIQPLGQIEQPPQTQEGNNL